MTFRHAAALVFAIFVSGCVTHIEPENDTIQPSKEKLGQFHHVSMKPISSATIDPGNSKVVATMNKALTECMRQVFRNIEPTGSPDFGNQESILLIEPEIVDMKKVSTAQRIFFGSFAGSSAALLKVTYTDYLNHEVIAEPVFYARAAAMGGAWTFGASDNGMLTRLPRDVCKYSRESF